MARVLTNSCERRRRQTCQSVVRWSGADASHQPDHEAGRVHRTLVNAGEYPNASAVVRDAIRALQQRRREYARKLEALRAALKVGQDALDRGDFVELDDSELGDYLDSLTASVTRAR
jgi:antitoxin ParD1/3/4